MHERHIARASAIVSATLLLSDLAAVVNGYLIPITDEDKVAALIADQRDPSLHIWQHDEHRGFTIRWLDCEHNSNPRNFIYWLFLDWHADIQSQMFSMRSLLTPATVDPANTIMLTVERYDGVRKPWPLTDISHEFIVRSVARLAADY